MSTRSVSPTNAAVRAGIEQIPTGCGSRPSTRTAEHGDGADLAKITDLLTLSGWPDGIRVIVRRERPHPGAQPDAIQERDGYRYQAVATNTPGRPVAADRGPAPRPRPRRGPDPLRQGHRHRPVPVPLCGDRRRLAGNGADRSRPDRRTQTMLLSDDPELVKAEPKKLRYRLLHTAARITHGQRPVYLRLAKNWSWALALARAFSRLRLIPLPTWTPPADRSHAQPETSDTAPGTRHAPRSHQPKRPSDQDQQVAISCLLKGRG